MSRNPRILIIDDDRKIVQALTVRLRSEKFEVGSVHDGAAGLSAATRQRPDTIVLDIQMPRLDGLTLLERLSGRSETRDIPVIVLSADTVEEEAALNAGAFCFISKPHDPQDLIQAIVAASALRDDRAGCTNATNRIVSSDGDAGPGAPFSAR